MDTELKNRGGRCAAPCTGSEEAVDRDCIGQPWEALGRGIVDSQRRGGITVYACEPVA